MLQRIVTVQRLLEITATYRQGVNTLLLVNMPGDYVDTTELREKRGEGQGEYNSIFGTNTNTGHQ